ncbi:MAG: plasmid replication, integration and excision activator [Nocardioidaceae bacterium]
MAMPRRFPVDAGVAFMHGLYMFTDAQVEPARDFEKSTRENPVQAMDEDTDLPVWQVDVMDADPDARKQAKSFTVRVISQYAPTLPDAPKGWPVRPVEFEGLSASPYVADPPRPGGKGRLAWSFRATGVCAPKVGANAPAAPASSSGASSSGKEAS